MKINIKRLSIKFLMIRFMTLITNYYAPKIHIESGFQHHKEYLSLEEECGSGLDCNLFRRVGVCIFSQKKIFSCEKVSL